MLFVGKKLPITASKFTAARPLENGRVWFRQAQTKCQIWLDNQVGGVSPVLPLPPKGTFGGNDGGRPFNEGDHMGRPYSIPEEHRDDVPCKAMQTSIAIGHLDRS